LGEKGLRGPSGAPSGAFRGLRGPSGALPPPLPPLLVLSLSVVPQFLKRRGTVREAITRDVVRGDVVRLHGCTVVRLYGCTAARLHGCTAARLYDCTAARLHSCTTARSGTRYVAKHAACCLPSAFTSASGVSLILCRAQSLLSALFRYLYYELFVSRVLCITSPLYYEPFVLRADTHNAVERKH